MRKYVKDLAFYELMQLVKYNSDIEKKAFDWALDNAYAYVEEYLIGVPNHDVDYAYFGRGEHFTVKDVSDEFINWVEANQRDYEWLNEDTYKKCKRAAELRDIDKHIRDLSDEEWEEYERLKDEIGDEIFALMKDEYDYAFEDEAKAIVVDDNFDEFFEDGDWVDTETWEIHNINDEDSENLDYDLDGQLELPIE